MVVNGSKWIFHFFYFFDLFYLSPLYLLGFSTFFILSVFVYFIYTPLTSYASLTPTNENTYTVIFSMGIFR